MNLYLAKTFQLFISIIHSEQNHLTLLKVHV